MRLAIRYEKLDRIVCIVLHPDEFEEFPYAPSAGEPPPYTNVQEFDGLLRRLRANPAFHFETLGNLAKRDAERNGHPKFVQDLLLARIAPWRIKRRLPLPLLVRSSEWFTTLRLMGTLVHEE